MIRSRWGTGRMNKADGQDTADRLSAIVANSLDTQAKTQDLARQAYQSRTQFHRLFRTVVEETRRDPKCGYGGRPWGQLRFFGGVPSRFPKSFSDFSQPLPPHA